MAAVYDVISDIIRSFPQQGETEGILMTSDNMPPRDRERVGQLIGGWSIVCAGSDQYRVPEPIAAKIGGWLPVLKAGSVQGDLFAWSIHYRDVTLI